MRDPITLKKFSFYTVKSVRIIFVDIFLQITSITPCEFAFNSLETHGLHVHTRTLMLCRSVLQLLPSRKVKSFLYIHTLSSEENHHL